MMRVLLVKPPERSRFNFGTFSLAVLAAAIEDLAEVRILDATSLGTGDAVGQILSASPDLVGVTVMGPSSVPPATDLVSRLREAGFTRPVVAGGHGATMFPEALLSAGYDAIVLGEGEAVFRNLLIHGISRDTRGICFTGDGVPVITPPQPLIEPLDSLNPPARHLIPPPPDGVHLLETSRGCPHGCAFCETTRFYGRRWRSRSPEIVARDIRGLVERGADIIQIADDNFTADPARAIRICGLLEGGPLPLLMMFFARSDDIARRPELASHLAGARFLRASIGVETTSPLLAEVTGKHIPFAQHKQAFSLLASAGIFTIASLIVGLPGETPEMREDYVDLVVELGADSAYFLPFQPLPGTPLGTPTGDPDPLMVREAAGLTEEFRNHPVTLRRLSELSREPGVRGVLARSSLGKRPGGTGEVAPGRSLT